MATVTVMELGTTNRQIFTCTPREAVLSAYAHARRDGNTWDYKRMYGHLVTETDLCVTCGDFSAFKDGRAIP